MKFIHTADIHLGHPFAGLNNLSNELLKKIEQATFTSFTKLIDFALAQLVDFIVISGDLFDTQHQSVQVLDFLATQFKRLENKKIHVYISFGNHDFNQTVADFDFGANVTLFAGNVTVKKQITQAGETVNIVGFSYQQQHVTEKVIDQFPMKDNVDFQIGMYHGSVDGQNGQYAPFTVTDMRAKHYDYWALGHIHKRQILSKQPLIAYPGNLQGQNIKEDGSKGFYYITNNNRDLIAEFIECADINWAIFPITIPTVATQNDLLALIIPAVRELSVNSKNLQMLRLEIVSTYGLPHLLELRLLDGATLAQINQTLRLEGVDNVWINDISLQQPVQDQALVGLDANAWSTAAKHVFSPENIHQVGLKNVPEAFVTDYFDQQKIQTQLQYRAQLQLAVYMNEELFDEN